jgi:hypothetical protein
MVQKKCTKHPQSPLLEIKGTFHTNFGSDWENENFEANFMLEQICRYFFPFIGVQKQNKILRILKFLPLVKVFEILSRNGFHGLKMVLLCSEGTI